MSRFDNSGNLVGGPGPDESAVAPQGHVGPQSVRAASAGSPGGSEPTKESRGLRVKIVNVRGPKRYDNGDATKKGIDRRMYPHDSKEFQSRQFMAGSTVYVDATPTVDSGDGQGMVGLQKADTDARGLAFKTEFGVKSPSQKVEYLAELDDEKRYQGTGGFEIGVHCDEEGQWASDATLADYGHGEIDWTIK